MTIIQIAELVGLAVITVLIFIGAIGALVFFFLVITDQYITLKTACRKNGNSNHGQA